MTIRWVRILAAFLLVVVPTTASATCAWVLWGQTVDPWNAVAALPLGGWPSRDACEQERARREQAPPELRMATYTCLPESVDPRRPKGT